MHHGCGCYRSFTPHEKRVFWVKSQLRRITADMSNLVAEELQLKARLAEIEERKAALSAEVDTLSEQFVR